MSKKERRITNEWCIVGFICAFLIPLLGLIFSIVGLNQVKKSKERGRGLAIAGIVISGVFIAMLFFVMLGLLLLLI